MPESYSDEELASGCVKGKREYQQALYQRFYRKMYGVCLRYTQNREDAEDIFQEAFTRVYRSIGSFRGMGSLEGWIRRIVVRTAIEIQRRNSKLLPVVHQDAGPEPGFAEDQIANLNTDDLLQMIRQLPAGYRTVFNLYEIEGYTHREISLMLDISEGTSKSQLSRAKQMLRDYLKQLNLDSYAG
jgi:RNA polymerase sigma-70 factor (ECF subfamily)